jgi:hypothetical protein
VAVAELLEAPLPTADARISRTPGQLALIEVV